ncbi:DUF3990 domain-containing protein [Streptomyces sp. PTM05]|uniref:DUF3990 domain-containing protein n=1 Tax=Streptantibioticus parmotrematis TaxID=2873249 RepID=A0ABS7QSD8_9ACTN|nr:LamG-like jellyroll fold domain-containing protein [Streptantibioticus parmotrematis]MBY8885843.1 DUF3990 domain-containing protein [Streptantibioticus parmotrematis]
MVRFVALLSLIGLATVMGGEQAYALGRGLPALSVPSLQQVVAWLKSPTSPRWGHLPQQQSGTASGHGHQATAASTRAGRGTGRAHTPGTGELKPYTPLGRKVDQGPSATLGHAGFNARTSKLVASKSTANSDYYTNADGTTTRRIAQGPINYRDTSGTWHPIDTSVHRGTDGRWHEGANSLGVDFADSSSSADLARVETDGSRSFGYGLEGASKVTPTVSGAKVTYAGVSPHTDLVLQPTATGLKESVVLGSADAGTTWTFPLDLKGLTPSLVKDGSVQLSDASGKRVGEIPPAYAYDSKIDPRSGERGTTHAVTYQLTRTNTGTALVVTLDKNWLRAPGRVFPVTVDPSYDNSQAATTYAESGNAGDHSMEETIKVGSYDSGTHDAVSYLSFPDLGIDGSKVSVSAASLTLFDVWAATCTAERLDVAAVTKAWAPSQVTSYPGPSYGSSIGNVTPSVPNGCANSGGDMSKGDNVTVPLSTSTINAWASGSSKDYGLAVYASTSDNLHWKQFGSLYDPGEAPTLSLTYTGAMLPQIVSTSPDNGSVVPTLTPRLAATGQIDPNLTATQKYDFQVYTAAGTKVVDSGLITANSYQVPAGKLSWGTSYYWEVQAYDGTNYSPGPNWQSLTPQVPQPVVTSQLSQNTDNHGYSPAIGNYTTSATDANVSVPGPSLSVVRDYNSRDPRTTGAFGAGWSSVFDARATERDDSSGALASVEVTYPDGSVVGYGKNSDGTFSPPEGRFATFKSVSGGGYSLTDKNATVYAFTQSLGSGVYGISSITDANGRAETFTWSSGHIVTMTSVAAGRALHLAWSTPTGATFAHVMSVATDPVTGTDQSTALTWNYGYTADELTQVCSPSDATHCATYGYTAGSDYYNQVLDRAPSSYWPLNETSGTTARSAVLAQEGADDGTYSNVTLGQPGPLAGGTATAAGFNGSSSSVQLPDLELGTSSSQSISLWFKTSTASAGVLFGSSDMPIQASATKGDFTPSLYVGSDGKLNGLFWYGTTTTPITTSSSVADGKWHHVVLTGSWTSQVMFLDGKQVGTSGGYGSFGFTGNMPWLFTHVYLGTGYLGSTWPDEPHKGSSTIYATYFNGSVADASFYDQPLTASDVSAQYQAGTQQAHLLTSVTRPSGKAYATIAYDPITGAVTHLTDENGGSWSMAAPTVSGSSQVYRGAVLGSNPAAYFRLGESAGASQAIDEVNSGNATYSGVTLGTGGPFSDETAASFNGTSSYVLMPSSDAVTTGPASAEMWFKMPSGNTAGGVLLDEEKCAITANPVGCGGYDPALYVGTDGKLYGKFWDSNGTADQIVTSAKVNDGKWHSVLLTASTTAQALYLDGNQVGTTSAALASTGTGYLYVGAGAAGGNWTNHPTNTLGYFPGSIAEVAFYRGQLTGQEAAQHWAAGGASAGLAPMETVKVTDPGGKTDTYQYDILNGFRMLSQTDGLGDRTSYGYDTRGFLYTETDPDGDTTVTGHDVRGNEVSRTTCQDQAAQECSTTYTTYLPDDTTAQLTPNAQNDLVATVRDGRSASATDTTYLTSYSYDAAGNKTGVTTPPVAGFPNGRITRISYTDGMSVAAADGGYAPKGLPYRTVSPSGATTTITYFKDGDVASVTNPDGLVTRYTYDNLGRVLTKTDTSDSYPSGLTTSYTYDGDSQVLTETDPAITNRVTGAVHQARTTTAYDPDGMVLSQTVDDLSGGDASRKVANTYDVYDQLASTEDAAGDTTTYTYDAYGNKATEQDPDGNTLAYTYDPNGDLLTQTLKAYTGDPVNPSAAKDLVETSRAYDPAGRLQSETDAMGDTTSYTYTDNGLKATVTRTDSTGKNSYVQESDSYDAAGNLVKQVTNNGATATTSTYDAADRDTSTTVDPTGVDRTTTLAYTPDDHIATSTITDATGATTTTSTTYDPMGNETSTSVDQDGSGHPNVWWPLNQTSGSTVTDESGSGNTGVVSSGVTWQDNAAVLSGSQSQDIATNGHALDTASSYTTTAWVNLAAAGAANDQTVASAFGNNATSFSLGYRAASKAWVVNLAASDTVGASGTQITAGTNTATTGTWTQVAYTFDASTGTGTLYVNGSAAASGINTTPWDAPHQLAVGLGWYNGQGTNPLNGEVSDVQAYQRPLSASDIQSLYSAGRTGGTTASSTSATTKWTLDQRGLPTQMTDPDGNVTNYTYDEAGNLVVTSSPAVEAESDGGPQSMVHPVTTVGYDAFGDQTETEDPDGNVTTTAYDADGRKASQTLPSYTPPGSSTAIADATTSWTYDGDGNVTKSTDPLQNSTSYLYDQLGDTAQTTDPSGGVTHTVYDANGEALAVTDPVGAQTQATYDYLGRPLTSTSLERYPSTAAYTTTNSYTASPVNPGGAFLASSTSPDGTSTSYGYDNVGEKTESTDGAGNTTRYTYDLQGRPTGTTLPDGTSRTVAYDQLGDPVEVTSLDTDGSTVLSSQSATYDADGNLMSATDPDTHTTTYTRNALGEVVSEVQPVDASHSITTSFGYDASGNGTRYTDGRGNATYYTYNSWNLPESTIEPSVSTSTYSYTSAADSTFTTTYDADGRAVGQTQPGGVTVTTGYDKLGDVTSQTGSGAEAATADRSFTYDADSRMLTAATAAIGSTTPATNENFGYDDRGDLLSMGGSAGTSSFSYNGDGLPTSVTDAAGTTSYGYDGDDRLATLSDPATGTQLTYGYNSLSQPTSVQYGTNGDTRTYGYDHLGRLTGDTLKTSAGATVASIGYGYDANGNETSKTTSGLAGASNNTYTYDWANRLTSWNDGTNTTDYAYDDSGNRIRAGSNVYTYDARDQLTSDGLNTYTYSARGTITKQASTSASDDFTSDAFGQQVTQDGHTYVTDALGRAITDTTGAGSSTTFAYLGTGNTLASDGSNTYTWTPDGSLVGIGTPSGDPTTGTLAYTDQHDDVVGDFSAGGTAMTASTGYDPLGDVTGTTGTPEGKLGYQSGWTESDSGKVNMAARWYNPAVGQFMDKDTASLSPMPNSTAANPFAYANDNPLTDTDPTGHWSISGAWHDVTHAASSAWHAVTHAVSSAYHYVADAVSSAWDTVTTYAEKAWDYTTRAISNEIDSLDREIDRLDREIAEVNQEIADAERTIKARAAQAARSAASAMSHAYHGTVHAVATAYHAAAKAVNTSAVFIKNHAAAIASFAASTVVFAGCEAAITAGSGATLAVPGAMLCGALAGAVGGAIDQGAKCMDGQKGACSVGAFATSVGVGAVGGAIGGGIGGALGGKLAESALGDSLPKLVTNTLEGAAVGGTSGAVTGAAAYGITCPESGTGCSWSGAAHATAGGAVSGAIGGAAGGALSTAAGALRDAFSGCGGTHSFTGATPVLMAGGSVKPIDQVKVGDKIQDSVPGQKGTQTHTVQKVIVTHTDHDFVKLTVKRVGRLKAAVGKAAVGLAATAAAVVGFTQPAMAADHHPAPSGVHATASSAAPKRASGATVQGDTLTTTFHHPFYDESRSSFVDAQHLQAGDLLQTPTGPAEVTALHLYHANTTTYDLTIGGLHTYYVLAGTTPILVHNTDSGCGFTDLYHGTTKSAAANIRANGVDTSFSSRPMDFGNGFYTTRDPQQAADWAARFGKNGTVLHFRIPTSQLDSLNSLSFSEGDSSLAGFVRGYRGGSTDTPYDMVEGPMLMNPGKFMKGASPVWGGNQVTFFGDTGPMLDAGLQ